MNMIKNAVAIAAGEYHVSILTADGTVTELSKGAAEPIIYTNTGFTALSGGEYYTVALKADGTVWTWPVLLKSPKQLSGMPKIVAIAAGRTGQGGYYPDIALAEDGTVWTWFWNPETPTPSQIPSVSDIIAITNGVWDQNAEIRWHASF